MGCVSPPKIRGTKDISPAPGMGDVTKGIKNLASPPRADPGAFTCAISKDSLKGAVKKSVTFSRIVVGVPLSPYPRLKYNGPEGIWSLAVIPLSV